MHDSLSDLGLSLWWWYLVSVKCFVKYMVYGLPNSLLIIYSLNSNGNSTSLLNLLAYGNVIKVGFKVSHC